VRYLRLLVGSHKSPNEAAEAGTLLSHKSPNEAAEAGTLLRKTTSANGRACLALACPGLTCTERLQVPTRRGLRDKRKVKIAEWQSMHCPGTRCTQSCKQLPMNNKTAENIQCTHLCTESCTRGTPLQRLTQQTASPLISGAVSQRLPSLSHPHTLVI
jgi:hypothetical protein